MNDSYVYVGVDVSKAQLDVGLRPSGEQFSVPNDQTGWKRLGYKLAKLKG